MRKHSVYSVGQRLLATVVCTALLLFGCVRVESTTEGEAIAGGEPTTSGYYPDCHAWCVDAQNRNIWVKSKKPEANEWGRLILRGVVSGLAMGMGNAGLYGVANAQPQPSADNMRKNAIRALRHDVFRARLCYDKKWRDVIAQYDSGQISKDEAEKRLREIHAGLEQVKTVIDEYTKGFGMQREQVLQVERGLSQPPTERKVPQMAQSQQAPQTAQQQGSPPPTQQAQQNIKQKDVAKQTARIPKIKKSLGNSFADQEKELDDLYHADDSNQMRRQKEAIARNLEL